MTRKSILVVDDEAKLRKTLEEALTKAGYRVTSAGDGREATKALKQRDFDLVLTDVLMPERDGIEVISDLRRSHPTLAVVAMSGGGQIPAEYYLKLAVTLGAKAILNKPFSNEQLLMTVAFALR